MSVTVTPDWGPVRVAWRCDHVLDDGQCRPRYCGAGRPVLEWTYARPLPPGEPFEDAPAPPIGPVVLPDPIERARPVATPEVPKLWRPFIGPANGTLAIGYAKSTGKAVRVVRSIIGRGELWRVVLESPPGPDGEGYKYAGGWAATGPDRKVRPVGASELKALIQSSRSSAGGAGGGRTVS